MKFIRAILLMLFFTPLLPVTTAAQEAVEPETRPEVPVSQVRGGIYDKPFMFEAGSTRIGGYTDLQYRFERVEGFTEEASFVVKQLNLFIFAPLHERVRLAAELEIEDGGEELKIELATLDFDVAPGFSLRIGMLLPPIGRFNVAHDSPANDFVDRPLVATRVVPTTLSEPGAGAFGTFAPWSGARVSYEAYAVNGFDAGVEGTFEESPLEGGKPNLVDNNLYPSIVGRVGFSPFEEWEIAVSGHSGPYNRWEVEDLVIDTRRDVTLLAVDTELRLGPFEFRGEAVHASLDLPDGLVGLRGERFGGLYAETVFHFGDGWIAALPQSVFTTGIRYGFVDHDLQIDGDHVHQGTVGVNFRPIEKIAFKLDYQRSVEFDRLQNPVNAAAILFGGAAYF